MSGAAKVRRTEITIKQGNETAKFKISIEAGRSLIALLRNLQHVASSISETEAIPAEEVFPNIKDPIKRIGIIFRGIRFKYNLTQEEVAKRLEIDQSDVSKIEKGKRPIGKMLAKRIEKEFGIDYRRFL